MYENYSTDLRLSLGHPVFWFAESADLAGRGGAGGRPEGLLREPRRR